MLSLTMTDDVREALWLFVADLLLVAVTDADRAADFVSLDCVLVPRWRVVVAPVMLSVTVTVVEVLFDFIWVPVSDGDCVGVPETDRKNVSVCDLVILFVSLTDPVRIAETVREPDIDGVDVMVKEIGNVAVIDRVWL